MYPVGFSTYEVMLVESSLVEFLYKPTLSDVEVQRFITFIKSLNLYHPEYILDNEMIEFLSASLTRDRVAFRKFALSVLRDVIRGVSQKRTIQ